MTGRVRAIRPHLGPMLVGTMLGALVAGRLETATLCLVAAIVVSYAAGATLPAWRWLATLASGAAIAWALNLYLTPGPPLDGWPVIAGHRATSEGMRMGALLNLRFAGAVAALQGLRAAWPGERAADAAARWLAPLEKVHVPVGEARAILGLAVRFMPLLGAEAARIARVQDLRAGRPPRGAREWLQRRRAATVPALVGALERAERVALALEARHYRLRPAAALSGTPGDRTPGASRPVRGAWAAAGTGLAALALFWRT